MNKFIRNVAVSTLGTACILLSSASMAAPGDLLATVTLPGNGTSVGGAMIPVPGGIAYATPNSFSSNIIKIYSPPAGDGDATLLATKTMSEGQAGGCIAWDSSRDVLWVGTAGVSGPVYSVDLGDPTVDGEVTATFAFNFSEGGISLCDGMAYDPFNDSLWMSPDVNTSVYQFGLGGANTLGTLMTTVSPKNEAGTADGTVSGVTVGPDNTLLIARNGAQEIRRIDKVTGDFISNFSQTDTRAEDLSCDTVTYAPLTAITAREFESPVLGYEAYEVAEDACITTVAPPPPVEPAEPVPALSRSGLLVMILMLGMGGILMRRRFVASN